MRSHKYVLVFGTFDILHPGHLRFLKRAARFGRLIIALTPDEMCREYKGAWPYLPYPKRLKRLRLLNFVGDIVPADSEPGSFAILNKVRPNVIALGYDQHELGALLRRRMRELKLNIRLAAIEPYRIRFYKSSLLRLVPNHISEAPV